MKWYEVDFKKVGWFSNPTKKYFVNKLGQVSYLNKAKNYIKCGSYSKQKSRIKVKGTDVQIKYLVACTFYSDYVHEKFNVDFKDGDASNCAFNNLFITIKSNIKDKFISEETKTIFNDYLENGNLNKMAGWVLNKKNFYPDVMYSDEDAKQEMICFCYYKLHQYDEKRIKYKDFDEFIFFKMFDAFCLIIQKKDKYSKYISFSIDAVVDSFEKGFGNTKYLIDIESIC